MVIRMTFFCILHPFALQKFPVASHLSRTAQGEMGCEKRFKTDNILRIFTTLLKTSFQEAIPAVPDGFTEKNRLNRQKIDIIQKKIFFFFFFFQFLGMFVFLCLEMLEKQEIKKKFIEECMGQCICKCQCKH